MRQTTCSSDLCNNLDSLKYIQNATLCYDGFYTAKNTQPTTSFKCNLFEYYYAPNGSLVYNSYEKQCNGTQNFCLQFVIRYF